MQEFIDRLGKAAQQTANETRLRLATRNLGGKLDERAQALGYLLFRRHEVETVAEEEMLKLLKEMSDLTAERHAREAELEALRQAPATTAADEKPTAPQEAPAASEAPSREAPTSEAPSQEAPASEAPGQPPSDGQQSQA